MNEARTDNFWAETHFTIPFIYILINGVRLTKLSGLFRNGPLLACLDRTIHSVEGIAYGPFNWPIIAHVLTERYVHPSTPKSD